MIFTQTVVQWCIMVEFALDTEWEDFSLELNSA